MGSVIDDLTVIARRESELEGLDECDYVSLGESGLALAAALEDDLSPLSMSELEARGLTAARVVTGASKKIIEALKRGRASDGLYMWRGGGVQGVALVGAEYSRMVAGRPVVMIPSADTALLTGSEDLAGLKAMLEFAEDEHEHDAETAVSLRAISWKAGQASPVAWLPPVGHPLHHRFKLNAARARLREANELELTWRAADMPMAYLDVDDVRAELVATWVRGSTVLMPAPDRVVLFDTADTAVPSLDVDFATLVDALPQCFTNLADGQHPRQARVLRALGAGFPTVVEREFLRERMAWLKKRASSSTQAREVDARGLLARYDQGEPLLAQAALDRAEAVQLTSPDFEVAVVSREEFGTRIRRRRPHEQARFELSFDVAEACRAATTGETAPTTDTLIAASLLADEREALVTSSDIDFIAEEAANSSLQTPDEALHLWSWVWAPARARVVVQRAWDWSAGAQKRCFVREEREGLCAQVETRVDRDETRLLCQSVTTRDRSVEVWRTALLNLRAATVRPLTQLAGGVYAAPWEDGLDFSRVFLMPELVAACDVRGEALVFAPHASCVFVTGSEEPQGLATVMASIDSVLEALDGVDTRLLTGWPWTLTDGALTRAKVPPQLAAWTERVSARLAALEG